ncbi:UBN2_3 domain-containing protein [Senna tora]|uniref:UBN2_3 domain-containing protein n=1 Tax=Senna tora TaxID=362788 RepID=A0A834WKK6_9FABA|nr:UBN2_3 domain-containing protein [Senna tora]
MEEWRGYGGWKEISGEILAGKYGGGGRIDGVGGGDLGKSEKEEERDKISGEILAGKYGGAYLNKGDKLNGNNYDIWHRKVQFLLEEQEVIEAIRNVMVEPSGEGLAQQGVQVWQSLDTLVKELKTSDLPNHTITVRGLLTEKHLISLRVDPPTNNNNIMKDQFLGDRMHEAMVTPIINTLTKRIIHPSVPNKRNGRTKPNCSGKWAIFK